jgi:hypothetical protein
MLEELPLPAHRFEHELMGLREMHKIFKTQPFSAAC